MNRGSLKKHLVEGLVTYNFTLHDVGGCVGTAFGHFSFGLTISWSQLLACV